MKQQRKVKSISKKMESTHTYQRQEEILLEWADSWEKDFNRTHELIRTAIISRDIGAAMHYSDQLRGLTEKRFQALENIIYKVCDPERVMKDRDKLENEEINPAPTPPQKPIEVKSPESDTIPATESVVEKVINYYKQGKDTKDIAIMCQISDHKTIKILVTAGLFQGGNL